MDGTVWASGRESPRALISCGVRDSLRLLFGHYAVVGARVWLPADTYPVYGELARAAGVDAAGVYHLAGAGVHRCGAGRHGPEILLVANPMKPLGCWLNGVEVATLSAWLAASPQRRVLIDTVYTFDTEFHATTRALFATGQAILLHSLTKGWLQPRLFGVALVPAADLAVLAPVFRAEAPSQQNLARARELLSAHAGLPVTIGRHLETARAALLAELPAGITPNHARGCTGLLHARVGELAGLAAAINYSDLPATVFGSTHEDIDDPEQPELSRMNPLDCLDLYEDAEFYDAEFAGRDRELPFLRKYAAQARGPVLEVACGTGRLTLPLAREGADISGLDVSRPMLERARKKSAAEGLRVEWIEQDCRAMDFAPKFALIFSATNAMQHLLDLDSACAFLGAARRSLAPEGRLILDVFNPNPAKLARTSDARYLHKSIPQPDGGNIQVEAASTYHADTQILHFDLFYMRAGELLRTKQVNMRCFFPEELRALCHFTGSKSNSALAL